MHERNDLVVSPQQHTIHAKSPVPKLNSFELILCICVELPLPWFKFRDRYLRNTRGLQGLSDHSRGSRSTWMEQHGSECVALLHSLLHCLTHETQKQVSLTSSTGTQSQCFAPDEKFKVLVSGAPSRTALGRLP